VEELGLVGINQDMGSGIQAVCENLGSCAHATYCFKYKTSLS
jgi:hypothetical protein